MVHRLRNLELHASHACNLACESCSHFSNHGHKGILTLAEAEAWMAPWSARLRPQVVSILGGEPTLNPDLAYIFAAVRRYWPGSMVRIVTNGFFLDRHPALPALLRDDPDGWLYLSIHHTDPAYQSRLVSVADWVAEWVAEYSIKLVVYRSYADWTQRYLGYGASMEPFQDGDPRRSWEICPAKYCTQLSDGKLWKCAPLTYIRLQAEKYRLSDRWDPFLAYTPLAPDASDAEVADFLSSEEEAPCALCPSTPRRMTLPLPLRLTGAVVASAAVAQDADTPAARLERVGLADPLKALLNDRTVAL